MGLLVLAFEIRLRYRGGQYAGMAESENYGINEPGEGQHPGILNIMPVRTLNLENQNQVGQFPGMVGQHHRNLHNSLLKTLMCACYRI